MSVLPLMESNPDVMNKLLHVLGVPDKWNIVDVYGLDSDALAWVPRPVLALILLYPFSDKLSKHQEEQTVNLKEKGQVIVPDLYYMKQYVKNACGTIALIHSVANNVDKDKISLKDGVLKNILKKTKDLTPEERGQMLLNSKDSDIHSLFSAHQELAMEGQTVVYNGKNYHHFIALVEKGGFLYELDGKKEFPINHGETTEESFLEDAAKICREFVSRNAKDVNFTVLAFTASDN